MYTEANKAIYGTLEALLLFQTKLSKILEEMGYHKNEYDWCGMNKIVIDKQCTIFWNVDDLKMSHVDSNFLSNFLAGIYAKYGRQKNDHHEG